MKKIIALLSILFTSVLSAQTFGGIYYLGVPNTNGILYYDGNFVSTSMSLSSGVMGNITKVGTVSTGVWNASPLTIGYVNDTGINKSDISFYQALLQLHDSLINYWQRADTGTEKTISSAYNVQHQLAIFTGQSNITTVGAIGTGTWNGTTVAVTHGGTGRTAPNYYFLTVSAPGSITTSAIEALGLSHSLSPLVTNSSDVLHICITGVWKNATVADAGSIGLYYGDAASNAAPANAAAISGVTGATLVGTALAITAFGTASGGQPFCLQGIVHGLTSGHTYWFDLGISSTSSTVITVSDVNISVTEL